MNQQEREKVARLMFLMFGVGWLLISLICLSRHWIGPSISALTLAGFLLFNGQP